MLLIRLFFRFIFKFIRTNIAFALGVVFGSIIGSSTAILIMVGIFGYHDALSMYTQSICGG